MFSQQGPGGVFYSAVAAEPTMHPLIEGALSLTPYAAGYAGAKYLINSPYAGSSTVSKYDILQKGIKNTSNQILGGIFNTFRIPEFMSPFLSTKAMGLDETGSLLDPSRRVGSFTFSSDMVSNNSSQKFLRASIGDEAFSKISPFIGAGGNFELVFERDIDDKSGRGRLIFQELQDEVVDILDDSGKKIGEEIKKTRKAGATKLLTDEVSLISNVYNADIIDTVADLGIEGKMNPAAQAVAQNLDIPGVYYDDILKGTDGQVSKFMLIPSVTGSIKTLDDLRRRSAYPTANLSMGINRFNRLLSATKEQIPIFGEHLGRFADATGLGLTTKPGPFYKQFFELGGKATKISAAYLGLQTVDHYRREGGFLGNVVASAGIAAGAAHLYEKMYDSTERSMSKTKFGAIAAGVQILAPGFDKGLVEGLATTAVNVDIGMSYIGKYSGLSYIRRGLEGIAPGITDYTTGLYMGLGAAALSYSGYSSDMLQRAAKGESNIFDKTLMKLMPDAIRENIGFIDGPGGTGVKVPLSKSQIYKNEILDILNPTKISGTYSDAFMKYNPLAEQLSNLADTDPLKAEYSRRLDKILQGSTSADMTPKQVAKLKSFFDDNADLLKSIGGMVDEGEIKLIRQNTNAKIDQYMKSKIHDQKFNFNDLNRSLLERIETINHKYEGNSSFLNNILRRTEIFGAEIYHSFFGATLKGDVKRIIDGEEVVKSYDEFAKGLNAKPFVRRFGALFLGVTAAHQLLTTGIFGKMEDPDELKDIYSGKKLVEMRAGRFWEGGGTPYEGNETRYFRPHAYATLMSQARERSVWGDDVERFNPLTRFALKNFTYYLEEKNYYDRPYPITGTAFEDVPVLGPILANTIGRLIKPPKLMHQEELMRVGESGQLETAFLQEFGSSADLGQIGPGTPVSPYSMGSLLGQAQYQFREIEGLTGYAKNYIQKLVTGRETLGTREFLMASSNQMDSPILDFWDMDLGGMAFTSEAIRRLLPRPRGDIERYNPIRNTMASYLPEKFKRGDPYRTIANGFARLPGKGYEALNPELKGLDPEDYPDIHKYKILADVAPRSRETLRLRNQLMERRAAGLTTEFENEMFDNITEYHSKQLASTRDFEYAKNAIKIPVVSDITRNLYQGAESIIRKVTAPIEYLAPGGFRPTSKLLGKTRSAIEVYEQERIYGTVNAFWDQHTRDWFRPAMLSAANLLGWDGKPIHVKKREEVNEHFDKLQFLKFMKLAQNAENGKDKKRYLQLASRTRTGVNPNGDAMGLYLSLPNAEKRFFDAFANAQGADREKILNMVPDDEAALYTAVWSRIDRGEKLSLLMSESSGAIDENYMMGKLGQIENYFQNQPLPGPDWIGWHKDVDLEDIKIKYLDNAGEELSDYDVWESQRRRLSRRPYLEGADLFMYENPLPGRNSLRNRFLHGMKNQSGVDFSRLVINSSSDPYEKSKAEIYYNDDRTSEIAAMLNLAFRG